MNNTTGRILCVLFVVLTTQLTVAMLPKSNAFNYEPARNRGDLI